MQNHRPGRVLLVTAGQGGGEDRPQGGQITEADTGQVEVQGAGAAVDVRQRGGQLGEAAYVELTGQDKVQRAGAAGDGEVLVAGQAPLPLRASGSLPSPRVPILPVSALGAGLSLAGACARRGGWAVAAVACCSPGPWQGRSPTMLRHPLQRS